MSRVRVYGTMKNNLREVTIGGRSRSDWVYSVVEFDTGKEERGSTGRLKQSDRDRNGKARLDVDWQNPGVLISVDLPHTDEQVSVVINGQPYQVSKGGKLTKLETK